MWVQNTGPSGSKAREKKMDGTKADQRGFTTERT